MRVVVKPTQSKTKRVQTGIYYTDFPGVLSKVDRNMGKIPHIDVTSNIYQFSVSIEVADKDLNKASMNSDTWVAYVRNAIKKAGLKIDNYIYDGWRGNKYVYQVICSA